MDPRQVLANTPDCLNGFAAITAILFNACGNWQCQGIVKNFVGRNAIFNGSSIGPLGNGKFALGGAGHALLVDGAHHHPSPIAASQVKYLEKAFVAVFKICGVQQTLAAGNFKTSLHLLPFSGIKHQWQIHIGDKAAD